MSFYFWEQGPRCALTVSAVECRSIPLFDLQLTSWSMNAQSTFPSIFCQHSIDILFDSRSTLNQQSAISLLRVNWFICIDRKLVNCWLRCHGSVDVQGATIVSMECPWSVDRDVYQGSIRGINQGYWLALDHGCQMLALVRFTINDLLINLLTFCLTGFKLSHHVLWSKTMQATFGKTQVSPKWKSLQGIRRWPESWWSVRRISYKQAKSGVLAQFNSDNIKLCYPLKREHC